jgi:iron complex outermembrane recepter protein
MIGASRSACFTRITLFCINLLFFSLSAIADPIVVDVPAQPMASALREFARQTGIQVAIPSELTDGKTSAAVKGKFEPADALNTLLRGSGLSAYPVNGNTFGIRSDSSAGKADGSVTETTADVKSPGDANSNKEAGKKSSQDFRMAHLDEGANSRSSKIENSASTSQDSLKKMQLTEIVVTAQKREERLQDVPVPVTAISAESLVAQNELRLQDYYSQIPGFTVTPGIQTNSTLSIRGVTTGSGTNPTVGITVDDVPYGSSAVAGGGEVVPDIDPGELARVEVLRGPQGTLYGASSMGGLLKFVTVDPSTDEVSGRIQAGGSSVHNGAELGYNVRGSVNIPLGDSLAVRASGFTRVDPGYIDNPILHINGVNEERVSGGRLSFLWRPSEVVSLKLGALLQQSRLDGSPNVDVPTPGYPTTTGLTDLQQNAVRGTGWDDRRIQVYNATLTAKLGVAQLTAVSGYNVNTSSDSFDVSYLVGPTMQALFGVGGGATLDDYKTTKFTQEIRLSAPIGQRIDWLLGGFYTDEHSRNRQNVAGIDTVTGMVAGSLEEFDTPTIYKEYAAFTDLTFHITDRFDVQVGGRESRIEQSLSQTLVVLGTPKATPEATGSANVFTYLLTPRFVVTPDLMVYARLASGYRAGGTNVIAAGVPPQYNPDKTRNYEIGVKADFLNHTLLVDSSLYYIDWKDIQIFAIGGTQSPVGYNTNGSRAKSQGLEISVESRPLTGLKVAGWITLSEAELTAGFPPATMAAGVYGAAGDRLPYNSRFSGNLSLDQQYPLADKVTGFVGATVSYVGDREGVFIGTAQRQNLPAYAKTDLRAGITWDSWTSHVYVTNVADKRGVLVGGLGASPPFGFAYIPPRTVGLSVVREF